jgi:hypothetical protein
MKTKYLLYTIIIILSFFLVSCPEDTVMPSADSIIISEIKSNPLSLGKDFEIVGRNFSDIRENSDVFINNRAVDSTDYINWSDTLITLRLPLCAENGDLYIKNEKRKSNTVKIQILDFPIIFRFEPNIHFEGDTVKIIGRHFGDYNIDSSFIRAYSEVSIPISWNDSLIIYKSAVTTNPYDHTKYIKIQQGYKTSEESTLSTLKPPVINSVSPTTASSNSSVELLGSGFKSNNISPMVENPELYINDIRITEISQYGFGKIIFKLPSNAVSGNLVAKRFGRESNEIFLKVIAHPIIESINPDVGVLGTQITVKGSNFTNIAGQLMFENLSAEIVSWNNSEIIAKVPDINQCIYVYALVEGLKSNEYNFKYPNCKSIEDYNFKTVVSKTFMGEYSDTLSLDNGYYKFKLKELVSHNEINEGRVKFEKQGLYIDEIIYSYSVTETYADSRVASYKLTTFTVTAKKILAKYFDDNSIEYVINNSFADKISISYHLTGGWTNHKTGDSGTYDEKGSVPSANMSEVSFRFFN